MGNYQGAEYKEHIKQSDPGSTDNWKRLETEHAKYTCYMNLKRSY